MRDWRGQGRFLLARGMDLLADGTATGRYGFIHGLYQQVLYERLAAARRARLHHRIGEWGERAFSARVKDPAAELAMHFERGTGLSAGDRVSDPSGGQCDAPAGAT